jgi:hypothetical protein
LLLIRSGITQMDLAKGPIPFGYFFWIKRGNE